MRVSSTLILFIAAAVMVAGVSACRESDTGALDGAGGEVVVYASVDQNYAEPVLERFEAETGISIKPVYDVEAAKTTGLVNRLLAERDRPIADVWWSGEFAQTVELADAGALTPYRSRSAAGIPDDYRDPEDRWTGFGGRARVLIANTERLMPHEYPVSIFDLEDANVEPDQIGMAYPVFGTTATHAAALYAALGPERARAYYQALADRGISVLDGNAVVRDMVADGRLAFGLTDTDDACGAVTRGQPVEMIFPDQAEGSLGTLIVPNTVGLVEGAPHPEAGQALVDYLLAEDTAADLVEAGWFQVTLRPVDARPACVDASNVRGMDVSLVAIAAQIQQVKADMAEVFVR